jgi:long-chain acyl-CoA synthetase
VRRVAVVLRRLGVEPGDRVVQVSPNRYEWILVDLAVHLVRGVHVALHATLAGPQILWQIRDCGARLVFLAGAEQAVKLTAIDSAFDGLKLVSYDTIENLSGTPSVQRLSELLAGIDGDDRAAIALQTAAEAQTTPECLATILYTSGTTGEPKGVMLSHGNLASNARASSGVFEQLPDDLRLCWLPLSHIFARTSDLYSWLVSRSQLALAESREQIIASCRALHPTILTGVPYFFDKLRRHLLAQPDGESPGRLTEMLGGRIRFCCSGGAALPNATAEFFWRHGVPLVQGYGLTESSPVITVSHPQANRVGAVGRAIPGVEIRIADDGEILTHGPHVMQGYWHRPQETAATIPDGWLRTGDLGRIDDDGYLWITGRKKELIVTAGGKNIAPVYLESLLAEEPLISQVAVLGEGRNYLSALIVPNAEALRAEIIRQRIPVRSAAEALVHPDVLSLYRRRIDERLAAAAQCEQIGRFALLDRAFTIEQGELTPTLKLRRGVIQEHFSDRIEKLYAD